MVHAIIKHFPNQLKRPKLTYFTCSFKNRKNSCNSVLLFISGKFPGFFQDFKNPKNSMDLTEIPWILWNLPFFCDSSDLCLLDCVPIMKEFFHLFLISWLNHFKNHSKAKDRLISIGSKWEKKSRNGFKWKSDYSNKRARKCTNCKCTKICKVIGDTARPCDSDGGVKIETKKILRLVLVMRVQIA